MGKNSTFVQKDSLPSEWSYMEWRMPVRTSPDSSEIHWVLTRVDRYCTSVEGEWIKSITVESNPLETLTLNPWTEEAIILDSEATATLPGGTIISVPTENIGSDRLGFTFTGDAAKSRISISLRLRASANTNTASVTCATVAPMSPAPSISPSQTITSTKSPTGFPNGCYSINNKDCIHPDYDGSSCTKIWLPNGARNDCVALGGECTSNPSTCCEPAECFGDNSYAACLPLSETTSDPTKAPTEASPSSPPSPSCTICDDEPTKGMKKKGKSCTDINLKKKCNTNASWIKKGYCQLSCYNEGLGYDGDVCCTHDSTSTPTKAPAFDSTSIPSKAPVSQSPTLPAYIVCDNEPTSGMKKKGNSCTDINLKKKCNKNASWIKKGYCQLSCYNEGLGYDGDVCCTDG